MRRALSFVLSCNARPSGPAAFLAGSCQSFTAKLPKLRTCKKSSSTRQLQRQRQLQPAGRHLGVCRCRSVSASVSGEAQAMPSAGDSSKEWKLTARTTSRTSPFQTLTLTLSMTLPCPPPPPSPNHDPPLPLASAYLHGTIVDTAYSTYYHCAGQNAVKGLSRMHADLQLGPLHIFMFHAEQFWNPSA